MATMLKYQMRDIARVSRALGSVTAGSVALLAGCASAPALDLASQQTMLDAKRSASARVYRGAPDDVRLAASQVLAGIDRKFQIALTETGLSAARGWSSYMGFSNVVGTDLWVVRIEPVSGGAEVFVNAVTRSGNRGPLEMASPDASGLLTDIPLASQGGLTPEEMELFHRRLEARLSGKGAGPTCEEAFGRDKQRFPLTCNRGGLTAYF